MVTAREKDGSNRLLDAIGIPYELISRSSIGICCQIVEFLGRNWRFWKLARRFQPDVMTGIMGPTIAVVGWLMRCPRYVFYDTECAMFTNRFVYPLATHVITPACYRGKIGPRHVTYAGYHELAYLHPARFRPDPEVVRRNGLDPGKSYCLVRFVGWWATHDRGERGLSLEQKIQAVQTLGRYGKVLITSEAPLPPALEPFRYSGAVEDIHHVLAFARLLYGESATMASESAVLGVPAVYVSDTGRGYTDEEDRRYGLVHNFKVADYDASLEKAAALLTDANTAVHARAASERLLGEKGDVTAFMVEFFEARQQRRNR